MRRVALLLVLAVFLPSLVLAWLAVRSIRDQQIIFERQQALLYQGAADALAKEVQAFLAERQHEFGQQVEAWLAESRPVDLAARFDEELRKRWPLAEVGFAVSLHGQVYAPSLLDSPAARRFRLANDRFLCNREALEVYWRTPKGDISLSKLDEKAGTAPDNKEVAEKKGEGIFATKGKFTLPAKDAGAEASDKAAPGETDFRQLVGDSYEGTLARFLEDKLTLLIWYRSLRDPQLVFGAQLHLPRVVTSLRELIQVPPSLQAEIAVALLDHNDQAVGGEVPRGSRPFVASEVGEALPHWQVAVHLRNPAKLTQSAQALRLTMTLIVAVLMLAIGLGGAVIIADLRRQLWLARQKTDFVSNVSHELKTPLTSIRMFSELLAEGRVQDESRRRQFLRIITAEAARLTRLINNVLDFARLERGEKRYELKPCDLSGLARETVEAYRPHLESSGFQVRCDFPSEPVIVRGDRDALAQVLVNLLSNAEKYSAERKEISIQLRNGAAAELRVLDRGTGVPRGCEKKIFEQFFRAHDSLASGIQGSGLGLTLARHMARAHGGDVLYEPTEGGGSCFIVRLPISSEQPTQHEHQDSDR